MKGIVNLYVDRENVSLAKSRGINLSSLFNNVLSAELEISELHEAENKEQLINKLKAKIGLLASELELKEKEIEVMNKEIENLRKKDRGDETLESIKFD